MDLRCSNFKEIQLFNARLLARASALPGVEAAAIAGNHPLDAGFTNSFAVVGREAEARDWPEISVRRVSPGYFRAASHTARARPAGFRFRQRSGRAGRAHQRGDRPQILLESGSDRPADFPVRLAADDRRRDRRREDPRAYRGNPDCRLPAVAQVPSSSVTLIARVAGDPMLVAGSLRAAVREIDPALAVFGVEPLETTLAQSTGEQRFMMLLVGVFAGLALVLAVIGIHGVLSYSVVQRRREIGIRVALGAEPAQVVRVVLGQGVRLTAIGLGVGVASRCCSRDRWPGCSSGSRRPTRPRLPL